MENITDLTADGNLTANVTASSGRNLNSEDYIIIVVSSLALVLNLLTMVAVYKCARKINNHNLLIINQCAVDVVYCISSIVNLANWALGGDRCSVVALWIVDIVSCALVLTNLCALTVDHFIAIYSAMRYNVFVTKRRILAVFALMYGAYIVTVLSLTLVMFQNDQTKGQPCLEKQKNYSFIGLNVWFGITLLLVIAVYSYIFHKSRQLTNATNMGTKSNLRKTWTSLWIIATFLVCFGFDVILFLLDGVVTSKDGILMARRVTRILHAINFICDPIIYAIRLPSIQNGYRKIWESVSGFRRKQLSQYSITATVDIDKL